nr:MAG TPA: hypothetical protein [Caudoviricetes sp.]
MNIDEFIEHTKEKAEEYKYRASFFESDNPMNKACIKVAKDHEQLAEWLEKSKEYQQLEEQGRLIKLPCKVGDTVYKVNKASKKVSQHKVIKFEIDKADVTSYTMQIFFENFDFCFLHHFGEAVFLTKSEAEAKLKELRGNND